MAPSASVLRVRRAAIAGLLVLPATACGGSSTGKAPSVTTAATPTTLATTTAPRLPSISQDAAAAQRILLRARDLPSYTESPSAQINGYVSHYSTCTRNPLLPGGQAPRSASQGDFLLDETAVVRAAQTTSISSFAAFADTEADARRVFTDLAKPDVVQCIGMALATALSSLTSSGTPATPSNMVLPGLGVGDESTGLRTTVPGRAAVSQYFDLTVLRRGRVLAFLFVSRIAMSPLPEADRQRLAGLIASRMG